MNSTTAPFSPSEILRRFKAWEIVFVLLGFLIFWPVGLAYLAWKLWRLREEGVWDWPKPSGNGSPAWNMRFDGLGGTGNAAFDDYKRMRIAELEAERRRLEEESRAFAEFLDELKRARDRETFDRFMRERRARDEGKSGEGKSGPEA